MTFRHLNANRKCIMFLFYLGWPDFFLPDFLFSMLSIQTGVTHYHYDKIGLAISVLVAMGLSSLFFIEVWRSARS